MGSYRRESDLRTLALECRRLLLEAGIRLKLTPMRPMHLVCVDIVLNGVCLLLTESNNFIITHICATCFVHGVGLGYQNAPGEPTDRLQQVRVCDKCVCVWCGEGDGGGGGGNFARVLRLSLEGVLHQLWVLTGGSPT